MKVLFFTKADLDSGNYATISRIRHNLEERYPCVSTKVFQSNKCYGNNASDLENILLQYTPDIIVGLHLYRCRFLAKLTSVPYIVICGGTDLNEDSKYPDRLQEMLDTIVGARAVVVFGNSMHEKLLEIFPNLKTPVEIIPQGVFITIRDKSESKGCIKERLGVRTNKFFVVIGRLRPVKDPAFVMKPFVEWKKRFDLKNDYGLLYLGSVEEKDEEIEQLLNYIHESKVVHHLSSVEKAETHTLIGMATAVINCSKSEGQCNVILEALSLGTPVIARRNSGNCSIISHGANGLLFGDNKEFQTCLTTLAQNSPLRKQLIDNGIKWIQEKHSSAVEADLYYKLLSYQSGREI